MIRILILTDNRKKWFQFIRSIMKIDRAYQTKEYMGLENKMFCFRIQENFYEHMRGAAFAHVIEDKEIDVEDFYQLILPTIKQRVTQYGSRTIIGEIDKITNL